MQADKTKNETATTRVPSKKMLRRTGLTRLVLIFVCFSVLIGQLAMLQIVRSEELQKRAVAQQLSDLTISANRGQIFDANGMLLAQTLEVCTVIMCPKNIPDDATRQKIADEVSPILSIDRDTLYQMACDSHSQYKEIARRIDKSLGDTFIEWANKNRLASVFYIITDYKRNYPMNSLLSTVLGFVNTEVGKAGYGAEGLEYYYNSLLSGTPGRLITALNAMGDELPTELTYKSAVDAENGYSLALTIDQYIQQVAEKYLAEAIASTKAKNRGVAIVMDVETGAILAMATKGDYDLNNPRVIADVTVEQQIAQMAQDEQSAAILAALRKQWRNKAVADFYEPGSVFKTFTASMGLEEGLVSETSTFTCEGSYRLPGVKPLKCHVYPRSHGEQTFAQAISNSCNPVFMTLGNLLGAKNFFRYFVGFGFTQKTGIDLPGEQDVSPYLYHAQDALGPLDLATSAIGQTFKVTPIQMITALSSVANGGYLMQPYIVGQVVDSDGNVVSKTTPTVKRQVISQSTAQRVSVMLAQAVNGGGAQNAYVAGYRVAGKTGTAEKTDQTVEDGEDRDVWASFGGFAPADDPKVAILVVVDEPTIGQYGGAICAPVAKKIFEAILPYIGIEPQYTQEEISRLNTTTPNVQGKALDQAQAAVTKASLKPLVLGKGTYVIKQVPENGLSIPQGGTVALYTDEESLGKTVKVPNLTGKTIAQVKALVADTGLNISFVGVGTNTQTAKSVSQSVEKDTKVLKGTVVTVNFIYEDTIA